MGESSGLGKDSSGHRFTSVSTLGSVLSVLATISGRTWCDSNKMVASRPTASASSCAPPGCDLAKSVMSYTCACQGAIRREEASVSRGSASAREREDVDVAIFTTL